jgi:hypothetical protein
VIAAVGAPDFSSVLGPGQIKKLFVSLITTVRRLWRITLAETILAETRS